jgi:hypothetical protein
MVFSVYRLGLASGSLQSCTSCDIGPTRADRPSILRSSSFGLLSANGSLGLLPEALASRPREWSRSTLLRHLLGVDRSTRREGGRGRRKGRLVGQGSTEFGCGHREIPWKVVLHGATLSPYRARQLLGKLVSYQVGMVSSSSGFSRVSHAVTVVQPVAGLCRCLRHSGASLHWPMERTCQVRRAAKTPRRLYKDTP